jgi:Zn-finger nucleic acid-binding protein
MGAAAHTRLLQACPACARQYDVSFLAPGERVRCECGARFEVVHREPRAARALCCSMCGGPLTPGASACAYCSAEIALADRGLGVVCPRCGARASARGRYCGDCGVAIEPQALTALREGASCPRCEGALRARAVEGTSLVECASCAGLWMSEASFVERCERFAAEPRTLASSPLARPARPDAVERVRYLPCPFCGDLMSRTNYSGSSGIIVDRCRRHGLWLDAGELERIGVFIRAGGLERARQREIERLERERTLVREARAGASMPVAPIGELDRDVTWRGDDALEALLRLFGVAP